MVVAVLEGESGRPGGGRGEEIIQWRWWRRRQLPDVGWGKEIARWPSREEGSGRRCIRGRRWAPVLERGGGLLTFGKRVNVQ